MAMKQRVDKSSARRQRLAPSRHTIAKQGGVFLALGLGLVAGGPAEATVVYTPVGQTVTCGILDFLNYNGADQFHALECAGGLCGPWAGAHVSRATNGKVVVDSPGSYFAALLNFGTPINASSNFAPAGYLGLSYYGTPYGGDWLGKKGYLGLQFTNGVDTRYGWAEMEVPADVSFLKIYGFAYEDTSAFILAGAGEPNPVPLPGSLALLASGAAGLLAYRRMKRAV